MDGTLIFLALVLVAAGAVIILYSVRWANKDDISNRLKEFVEDTQVSQRPFEGNISFRPRELSGSLSTRVFLPLVRYMGDFFARFTPAHSYDELQHKLYIAGYPMRMGVREFYGLRAILLLLSVFASYVLLRRDTSTLFLLLSIIIPVMGLLFPTVWLNSLVKNRQEKVRRSLPDALDMLSVCVQAGLAFDQALQRVSIQWNTVLSGEFGRVVSEIEMGVARRVALRNLADRLDVTELSSFVAIIIQSEQLGMSISDTLHSQAEQMRVERQFRAQEQARTIPVKMLLPLTFFIFPALLAMLLAPALPQLVSLFGSF